jgi:ribosomal protein L11 methyltransferase
MKPIKQLTTSSSKRKKWHEVRVEIPSADSEAVANFLIEGGSPGVAQDEVKGPEGQRWERLTAYYDHDRSWAARNRKIRSYLRKLSPGRFRLQCRLIREEKWAEAWKENFKTRHITDRIVVRPPWEEYESRPDELVLTIDPGMA